MKLLVPALALGLVTGAAPPLAGARVSNWFDWDRYHARQDACVWKDRIVEACAQQGYCDDLALRQAARDCSPWGPLGQWR